MAAQSFEHGCSVLVLRVHEPALPAGGVRVFRLQGHVWLDFEDLLLEHRHEIHRTGGRQFSAQCMRIAQGVHLIRDFQLVAEALPRQKFQRALPLCRECAPRLRVKARLKKLSVDLDIQWVGMRRVVARSVASSSVRSKFGIDDCAQERINLLDALDVLPGREALRFSGLNPPLVRTRDI